MALAQTGMDRHDAVAWATRPNARPFTVTGADGARLTGLTDQVR